MTSCSNCGSYAINHHLHGRDGSDPHLCDVCYWRARAENDKPVKEVDLDEFIKNIALRDILKEVMKKKAWIR